MKIDQNILIDNPIGMFLLEIPGSLDKCNQKFKSQMLFQVETVGDKYMCVSGLPDLSEQHAHNIAFLALDMMKVAMEVKIGGKHIVVIMKN